jgi:hypothetical protein
MLGGVRFGELAADGEGEFSRRLAGRPQQFVRGEQFFELLVEADSPIPPALGAVEAPG